MVSETKSVEQQIRTVGVVVKPNAPEAVEALKSLIEQHPEYDFVAESIGYHALENFQRRSSGLSPASFSIRLIWSLYWAVTAH